MACLACICAVVGVVEFLLHIRKLNSIDIRIVVNGSRGKSSVTRLIAAGLRAAGVKVFAKTTGTAARMVYPDGNEAPINRRGNPNIIEQRYVVNEAVRVGATAMVIECMSIRPELQKVEVQRLINPTIYVITNVRSDHLEVMGPTIEDAATAMLEAAPKHAIIMTAEDRIFQYMEQTADRLGLKLMQADTSLVADSDMLNFPYIEHKENVALALTVLKQLGIDRDLALQGMYNVKPDPGALRVYEIEEDGKHLYFVNAMAANDPDSTRIIWERLAKNYEYRVVLINCRADRVERSKQLARLCATCLPADYYVVTGYLTKVFIKHAMACNIPRTKLIDMGASSPAEIYTKVTSIAVDGSLIFAIGNIVVLGHEIVSYFVNKAAEDG